MMDSFIYYALAAGIAVALVAAPLGTVVVWRRMAYFGDTLAHAALLGIALAVASEQLPMIGVALIGVVIAVLLFWLEKQRDLSTDTLLGILSHTALALGLIMLSIIQSKGYNVNLMSYLFGDLLTVTRFDLALMYGSTVVILLVFFSLLSSLISISVDEELARIDGVAVEKTRFIFMVLLALVIAVAIKVVGILLITALLIIPAATARVISKSPRQMILYSVVMSSVAVIFGLYISLSWDLPASPSIVVSASCVFFLFKIVMNETGILSTIGANK